VTPKPLTPKQDAWIARWLTNGFNPVDAYMTVYNATNMNAHAVRREADKVISAPAVQARLQELRQGNPLVPVATVVRPQHVILPPADKPAKPDKEWLLNATMDVWRMALQTGNLGQAKSALELIGKITGDLVDRKETRVVRTWSDLSDAEVDALAAGEVIDATISAPDEQSDGE